MHVCRILVDKENVNTEKVNQTHVQLKKRKKSTTKEKHLAKNRCERFIIAQNKTETPLLY